MSGPCATAKVVPGGIFIKTRSVVQSANILSLVQAAPDLLAACKLMNDAVEELLTEYVSKKRATNWGVVNEAGVASSSAIRKAEGLP